MLDQAIGVVSTQPALLLAIVFVLGLVIGSFLNVVIYRVPVILERDWQAQAREILGQEPLPPSEPFNIVVPRSRCPACGHGIRAFENIPLVSWLILRGRCSACRAPISIRYPLVELLTGALSLAVAAKFGASTATLLALPFTWALIALTFIDLDTQLLPDNITLPLLGAGLLQSVTGAGFSDPRGAIIGAIAGYLSLWAIYHVFKAIDGREGLGYGDFKLLAALGAWFGWLALPLITVLAAGVGALVALTLIVTGRQSREVAIAFGPYLAAAGFVVLIWGDALAQILYGRTL